jgi:hypothetical protein
VSLRFLDVAVIEGEASEVRARVDAACVPVDEAVEQGSRPVWVAAVAQVDRVEDWSPASGSSLPGRSCSNSYCIRGPAARRGASRRCCRARPSTARRGPRRPFRRAAAGGLAARRRRVGRSTLAGTASVLRASSRPHVTAGAGDNAAAARRLLVVLVLAAEALLGFLAPGLADLFLEDLDAERDALVADVDAGASDQFA